MKCVYINLDAAVERRAAIEASFRRVAPVGWQLVRFPAVSAADVGAIAGRITPAEKACFRSHLEVLEASLGDDDPVMIVEDDAVFSGRCFQVVEPLLGQDGWDLILTETLPYGAELIVSLLREWPVRAAGGDFALLDLAGQQGFASSAGYVATATGKRKLVGALEKFASLDAPYDLTLNRLVRAGELRAGVIFPFVTSIDPAAHSQIQAGGRDFVTNALRRLLYTERDAEECRRTSETLRRDVLDDDARFAGDVFAAIAFSNSRA